MSTVEDAITEADRVRWDLTPIEPDGPAARTDLDQLLSAAREFAEAYRGRVAALTADEMLAALDANGSLDDLGSRAASYISLRLAVDSDDAEARDLSAYLAKVGAEAGNLVEFFNLEWLELDDDAAAAIYDDPALEAYRYYLISLRKMKPYALSEKEEQVLNTVRESSSSAWQSLHGRTLSTVSIPFSATDGDEPTEHTIDAMLAYMRDARPQVRKAAYDTLFTALEPHADVLARCYDALVANRLAVDSLRGIENPMLQANLSNDLSTACVDNLIEATTRFYPLAQRYWRAKATALGIERPLLSDQYAPMGEGRDQTFTDAVKVVDESFTAFDPEFGEMARGFLDQNRIDAGPRPGKRGGAFCASVAHDLEPYIMLNFTGKARDAVTLAHELGHGLHFIKTTQQQNVLSSQPGMAICEIPSTFAQYILEETLVATETDPVNRVALLAASIEDAFASIFRQIMMARYERRAYEARARSETLTAERLCEFWLEENRLQYGDALELPEGYQYGWAYIPHFIGTRFYTYSYSFAHLSAFALRAKMQEDKAAFVPLYMDFLSAGASRSANDLLMAFGLDLDDPSVWDGAFAVLEAEIAEAEAAFERIAASRGA